jgi:thiol:disulfide interchange protein DsbD
LGRSGVPVYVLHRPGREPLVLSEILTVPELMQALQDL